MPDWFDQVYLYIYIYIYVCMYISFSFPFLLSLFDCFIILFVSITVEPPLMGHPLIEVFPQ